MSLAEAREQYRKCKLSFAENQVKRQWYYALVAALERQEESGSAELDFTPDWISGSYETTSAVREYYDAYELPTEGKNSEELLLEFIRSTIGEVLDAFGLELRPLTITNGLDSARRIYLLKSDQQPTFNRY